MERKYYNTRNRPVFDPYSNLFGFIEDEDDRDDEAYASAQTQDFSKEGLCSVV